MAGDNNFLQFDPNKLLIMNDADYNASLSRLNGVSAGQASAALHNKLFYQMSMFVAAFAKAISDNGFNATDTDFNSLVNSIKSYSSIEKAWPVGSIYYNETDARNPHDIFGFGTWVAYAAGRVLIGADGETYIATNTGGEETHTLTVDEIPSHEHDIDFTGHTSSGSDGGGRISSGANAIEGITNFSTNSAGGGEAHNNMQPYIVAHIWKRTA